MSKPTLYHCKNARSLRPLWAMEELGVAYDLVNLVAICQYLVDKLLSHKLAISPDEPDYGAYLNWLHYADATLTFPQTIVLRYTILEPETRRQPVVSQDYAKWFAGRLRAVESILEERFWLVGDRFTIADIAVGYGLFLSQDIPALKDSLGPNARAYLERLCKRPAFKRAMKRQNSA